MIDKIYAIHIFSTLYTKPVYLYKYIYMLGNLYAIQNLMIKRLYLCHVISTPIGATEQGFLYLLLFVTVLLNFNIKRKIMETMKISLFNLMVPTMESSLLKSLSEFSYCVYVPGYVQVYVCQNTCVNVRK